MQSPLLRVPGYHLVVDEKLLHFTGRDPNIIAVPGKAEHIGIWITEAAMSLPATGLSFIWSLYPFMYPNCVASADGRDDIHV